MNIHTAAPTTADERKSVNEADPDTDESRESVGEAAPQRLRLRKPSATVAVLLVLLLAVSVVAGVLAYQLSERRSVDTARTEAIDTARSFALTLFTYRAETFDEYIDDVLAGATGDLAETFAATSNDLKATLVEAGATSEALILDSATQSATADRAEVLVIVNQTASNSTITEPRTALNAVVMTLEKQDGGGWLTSDVTNPSVE